MKTKDLIADLATRSERPDFTPTRAAGLARLATLQAVPANFTIVAATMILVLSNGRMYRRCHHGLGIV